MTDERFSSIEQRLTRLETITDETRSDVKDIKGKMDAFVLSFNSIQVKQENHSNRIENLEERNRNRDRIVGGVIGSLIVAAILTSIGIATAFKVYAAKAETVQVQAIEPNE